MSGEEILDLVVAGAGPAGTAAAFRARELGLTVQVLDYDDVLKRIRDYSKEKLILPGFGGGDRLCFPKGGELVSALAFAPIDKDDMCAAWKGLYREHRVPVAVGVELTGLERRPDGVYRVCCWDHERRAESHLLGRHVALALGRGVPRRFDIPGDTDGIAYRLVDPERHVGAPALVIGGGTSAAEAVIAISAAKAAAGDPTPVYWSYRGDKMPRVSKALAEVFFEAYVGRGNIRYYPRSEPAAVVTAGDRREYLALRIDRRRMEGRPAETTHLEFPKEAVVACIGEDLPTALLAELGIPPVAGGPSGKTRLVVDRHLRTARENLFLAGDLLSQAYFETDDFDADPAGFREVKHRGNVKSALRDGVLVAEVVRQLCDGKSDIEVRLEDAEEPPPVPAGVAVAAPAAAGPPDASLDEARRPSEPRATLVRLLPTGVEEEEHAVRPRGVTTIGRAGADVAIDWDPQVSPAHASIVHGEEGYLLRDDGSEGGVFYQLPPGRQVEVDAGDLVRLGRQFALFELPGDGRGEPAWIQFDAAGAELGRHPIAEGSAVVGRKAPDVTLDPDDRTLSRRHLAISRRGRRVTVKDLKSVNGSFLKVRRPRPLEHGDRFRIGQQLFAFTLSEEAIDAGHHRERPAATTADRAPAADRVVAADLEPAPADGIVVTFQPGGETAAGDERTTVCDLAEARGVAITAECHSGICGSDPVRILAGAEHVLEPPGAQERETLEDLCELEPGPCRLACMLRVGGPVTVEILGEAE